MKDLLEFPCGVGSNHYAKDTPSSLWRAAMQCLWKAAAVGRFGIEMWANIKLEIVSLFAVNCFQTIPATNQLTEACDMRSNIFYRLKPQTVSVKMDHVSPLPPTVQKVEL